MAPASKIWQGMLCAEHGDQMCETIESHEGSKAKKVSKIQEFGIEVEDPREPAFHLPVFPLSICLFLRY